MEIQISRLYGRKRQLNRRQIDFYSESIRTQRLSWQDAYWCCKNDIGYICKHERRFENRYKFSGVFRFLILAIATILTVVVTAYMIWGLKLSINQVLTIIVASLILIMVEFILRTVYYHKIELNLIRADNRISILSEIWPEIINIASPDAGNDTEEIPPEPGKIFSAYETEQNATCDQHMDVDFSVIFDGNEEEKTISEDPLISSIDDGLWIIEESAGEIFVKEEELEVAGRQPSLDEITIKIKALDKRLKRLQEGS